jgi:hypothetical protein
MLPVAAAQEIVARQARSARRRTERAALAVAEIKDSRRFPQRLIGEIVQSVPGFRLAFIWSLL